MDGGIEFLKPLEEAQDVHEAVGIWWARQLLSHHFDYGSTDERADESTRRIRLQLEEYRKLYSVERRHKIEACIGSFAVTLADLSRDRNKIIIRSEYTPDDILIEAALKAGMGEKLFALDIMRVFPIQCETFVWMDKLRAKAGETGQPHQVWPPEERKRRYFRWPST